MDTPSAVLKKFVGDVKELKVVAEDVDQNDLQEDDDLSIWTKKWGMQFNVGKCKAIHLIKE